MPYTVNPFTGEPEWREGDNGPQSVLQVGGNSGTATPDGNGLVNIQTVNSTPKFVGSSNNLIIDFGLDNLAEGSSFPNITTGTRNVAYGRNALNALTTNSDNTAIGWFAGYQQTTVAQSVAVGGSALSSNILGNQNVAIGYASLGNYVGSASTATGNNVAIGSSALNAPMTGGFNIGIGSLSGSAFTGSEQSNILISSPGVSGDVNTIRIGSQGTGNGQQTRAFIAGVTGVTVTGDFVKVSSTGQLGSVAAGSIGQTITGNTGGAIAPVSGNWNLLTANTTVNFAGTAGTETLNFGIDNLIVGSKPAGLTAPATQNTGFGLTCLLSLTTGTSNTCFGIGSGALITTSSNNTYIGSGSGQMNVASLSNTGVGASALAKQVGAVSAGNNTALGAMAGGNLTTGSNNIYIGSNAGTSNASSESSNIYIGNNGVVTESNTIRIGTQGSSQQSMAYIAGQLNGLSGRSYKVTTPGAYPYAVLTTDHVIIVDTTAARNILLPANPVNNAVFFIKDNTGTAATNNISISGNGHNIDGAATALISINYGSSTCVYNGTQWNLI